MPFFANLNLYKDAEPALDEVKRPLVMFSHGRGSNGLYYAWFGEFLASRGYIVAALNHYRANTYDATIAYLANKLWQRCRIDGGLHGGLGGVGATVVDGGTHETHDGNECERERDRDVAALGAAQALGREKKKSS